MSWKDTIRAVAPMIGKAISVINPVAGLAVQAASNALLGRPDGSEDELAAAVAGANPDQLLALKTAENTFKLDMERMGVDLEAVLAGDRKSAREMGMKTSLVPQMILSVIYVLAFSVILYVVFMGEITMSESQASMANYLLGILSAGLLQIMNFFFGSSKSSQDKNAIIGAK